MPSDKAGNDDVLVGTCKYCGTETHYKLRELKGDEPLTCRTCGAPAEIEVPRPPEKRAGKETKFLTCGKCGSYMERRDVYYFAGLVCCPPCYEKLRKKRTRELREIIIRVTIGLIIMSVFLVIWLFVEGC